MSGIGWGPRLVAVACLVALAAFAPAAGTLAMSAAPVFNNGSVSSGLVIDVQNYGPDAMGAVVLETSFGSTTYPMELPRGAHKRLIGYPIMPSGTGGYMPFEDVKCKLETNRGNVEVDPTTPPTMYGQTTTVLEISDELGGLQFLSKSPEGTKFSAGPSFNGAPPPFIPVYVKPESAPIRLASYEPLGAILMGPGAERISDGAVAAIHAYVMRGGRLIFSGGDDALYYRDKRWEDLLPIVNPTAGTKSLTIPSLDGAYHGTLAVQNGQLLAGSSVEKGDVITRMFGLGLVCALPYSILDGELQVWNGRYAFFGKLAVRPTAQTLAFRDQDNGDRYGFRHSRYTIGPPGGPSGYSGNSDNPFNYEPPPAENVFYLLGAYLILVVPVNFLILRRLRRIELAWVTTPLISVVFAGVILGLAAKLYLGRMTTKTTGALIAVEGEPIGVFSGTAQVFFPSGGTYDLRLQNVDAVHPENAYDYSSRSSDAIEVGDVGQVVMPDLSTHNLEFKEMALTQYVDVQSWLRIETKRSGRTVVLTISNLSPYAISNVTVAGEGDSTLIQNLPAGATSTAKLTAGKVPSTLPIDNLIGFAAAIHRPVLSGTVIGIRVGPQPAQSVGLDNVSLTFVGAESTAPGGDR